MDNNSWTVRDKQQDSKGYTAGEQGTDNWALRPIDGWTVSNSWTVRDNWWTLDSKGHTGQ